MILGPDLLALLGSEEVVGAGDGEERLALAGRLFEAAAGCVLAHQCSTQDEATQYFVLRILQRRFLNPNESAFGKEKSFFHRVNCSEARKWNYARPSPSNEEP